ncbi:MAG: frr, ribosome recycling factor, ribosome recycling factor [Candidatus Doudnabacteria bacterium]|nr:frr, ribosome recycling factor, ribosome recycling factor [Candidatus Doudnabacteria bacterium]
MNTEKFDKGIEHFKQEIAGLRTGRASSGLVENIMVDSYGSKMPMTHLASISIPDARSIAIQPWDKSNLGPIEKAIQMSNVGLNPVNDGILIRLNIPQMTEERRKEMVKQLGQMAEQAKIAVRNIREEIIKDLKRQQEEDNMTEDDFEGQKKDLQEVVDKYNDQIKEIAAAKEKEVMTI